MMHAEGLFNNNHYDSVSDQVEISGQILKKLLKRVNVQKLIIFFAYCVFKNIKECWFMIKMHDFFVLVDDLTTKSDKKCQICSQKVSHFRDTPMKILSPSGLMGIPISKNG